MLVGDPVDGRGPLFRLRPLGGSTRRTPSPSPRPAAILPTFEPRDRFSQIAAVPDREAEMTTEREEYSEEMNPSRYIERVSLVSGEVLEGDVEPHQLLVHSHRDYHVADIQARRFMARLVSTTGDEEGARERMRAVRSRGHRAAEVIARSLGHKGPGEGLTRPVRTQGPRVLLSLQTPGPIEGEDRSDPQSPQAGGRREVPRDQHRRQARGAGPGHRRHRIRRQGDPLAGGPRPRDRRGCGAHSAEGESGIEKRRS